VDTGEKKHSSTRELVIGSGIRGSKLLVPGDLLAALPGATVLDGLARHAG